MADSEWYRNPLPHGLTSEKIEAWARLFAPKLFFHRHERDFPSDPERFRATSRFREARQGAKDRGWSTQKPGWEASNDREPEHFDVAWTDIVDEAAQRTGDQVRVNPATRGTLRPHGGRNLYRSSGRPNDGLFLERDDARDRSRSGNEPVVGVVTAPVFLDAVQVDTTAGFFIKVLFWFFYELNHFHGFLTHEGDWEHVSYLVSVEDFQSDARPSHVYFAQHNGGDVRSFSRLSAFEGAHPHMFVDRNGHPTRAEVAHRQDFTSHWNTWDQTWRWIRDEPWREFSGAWGEVGNTKHTTGPLGPWFKQGGDLVRVKRDQVGQLRVSIPKS